MEFLISVVGSIFGSIAGKAAEYTVDPIAQQLSYLFKHKSKFQNLGSKVQDLKYAREKVQNSVHEANRNGEEIFDEVNGWLDEVNEKISEQAASQLQEDEEKAMKRCFAGFCPDFKSRYQLSKKAEKEADTIAKLLNQKDSFGRVSHRPVLEVIRPVKEYAAFGSRSGALNGVMEALKDDNVNIIGVYGIGGVGKTTLVNEAARQVKEKQLFDEVVLVAIAQIPNMVNIQNEIAEKLGLKIGETSMDVRAARLRERLKKEKVLTILDDIWVTLDLEALGIPSRDEQKGCKILMTSRKLDVLESMNSQKNFAIEILKEDEAWSLFKNMAGHIVESSDLQSTAIEVAQKCAGLPIAIATVAKALKHKQDLFEWKNALRELRRPSKRNFKGIPADAYSAIELSYKFLEVEEHQPIFLLCSIMGHNAAIGKLLRYGMGLGLFHGVNTIEETRDKVLTLVSNLKASCLLLGGSNPMQFDMHDVVRDVAISIASRDRYWLVLGKDDVFEKWSDEETMKNCNLISLQDAKVSELLDHELECPNLTFFSMGGADFSLKIPDNFFKGTKRLKVLDFTKMRFSSLPSSIGSLKTLCTLCLLDCDLKDIVILGELENLEILSLRRSRIAMLPKEIGQLTRLKLLDLSRCDQLKVISPNVLSSLSRLEELYLYGSFDRWEVEGNDNPRSNAGLVELQHLSHLTTLEVHIPNEQAMPKDDLFFAKMERYKISIGMEWGRWGDGMETSRMLKLKMNKSIHLYDGVKTLLRKTKSLYLDGVKDVMNMLHDPISDGLPHLKLLHVSYVPKITFVINSVKLVSCKAFPLLESLHLKNLINLEAICDGKLKTECFGQLKVIKVVLCKMLKNLFSFSIAKQLRQLEEIEVSNCKNITELIVEKREEEIGENEVIDILEFSQLRSLKLEYLQSFIGLCYLEKKLSSSQQGRIQSNATWLFDQKVLFPAMKELTLYSINSIEKLWHHQLPIESFDVKILTSLEVKNCNNLKYVFTSSMVKSFVQLKRLVVSQCDKIEEVIEGILEERISSIIMLFPKLDYLELLRLPNLKRFCCGINPIQFPFLRKLTIKMCSILTTFHSDCTSVRKSSSNISMGHNLCTNVPQSYYLFNEKASFPMLEELKVEECHGMIKLVTHSTAKSLVQLREMRIHNCEKIEEIIELGGDDEINFPRLNRLEFHSLPNLKSFCSSGNFTLGFSSLETVLVQACPKMEMFSGLQSNTPMLHKVGIDLEDEDIWKWEGSLNSTIQQLFKESNAMVEECENSEEDQSNSSTSNTKNLIEEVRNSLKDQGNSSTSNTQ